MADTESAWLADFLGYIASISFTIQYIPQTIHNYRRKTMLGFSAIGMIKSLQNYFFNFKFICVSGSKQYPNV